MLPMAAVLAAIAGTALGQDGRLSLAERMARLEQQVAAQSQPAGGAPGMELLNRIQDMQSELQSLRNLVEQQRFEIEDLKKRQRDQYIDLDSRIQRLSGDESGGAVFDPLSSTAPLEAPVASAPRPADPNQLLMEEAEPVDPYTGEPIRRASAPVAGTQAAGGDGDPEAEYQVAFDALKQGRYADSTRLFAAFIRNHPGHELADNAQYWLGESHYVTQNYETALETFRSLLERYPDGDKTADAELKIGYCLYELGRYGDAQRALEAVIDRHPESTVARLAQSRLRALALEQR